MQIKTQGIILKQRNIGENDKILTVLTPDLGTIEVSARRIKSNKSSIAGPCQILSYSDLWLYKGKNNYIVNSAETIKSFYDLRLDVIKVSLAVYFCELIEYLSPTEDTADTYIKFILNTLYLLEQDKKPMELLKAIFELRALTIAGFMPDLVSCGECNSYESDLMYFFPQNGSIMCYKCFEKEKELYTDEVKYKVVPPVLSALRHIVYSEPQKVFSFNLTGDALKQLCFITENYSLYHTEKLFNSLNIYKSLTI